MADDVQPTGAAEAYIDAAADELFAPGFPSDVVKFGEATLSAVDALVIRMTTSVGQIGAELQILRKQSMTLALKVASMMTLLEENGITMPEGNDD
jgi:hypothetical protein